MDQDREQFFFSVIVAKLHFLKVEREAFWGDAMMFDEPFLGITPKAFQAIDIDLAATEMMLSAFTMMLSNAGSRTTSRRCSP